MLRYVCLLFVVNAIAFAQPARLWKRDAHASQSELLRIENDRRYIYTHSNKVLYKWDTEADTVVRRVVLPGQGVAFMDDSTLLVETLDNRYAHARISDGSLTLSAPYDLPIRWMDQNVSIAIGWIGYGDTTSIALIDMRTFTVIAKGHWGFNNTVIIEYDEKRKVIYGLDTSGLFAMNLAFEKKSIMKSYVPYEEFNDIEVVDDGTLLVSLYKYGDSSSRIVALDPVTQTRFDSLVISGPAHRGGVYRVIYPKNIVSLNDGSVLFQPSVTALHVLHRNPLRLEATITMDVLYNPIRVLTSDSVYLSLNNSTVVLFNPQTLAMKEVLPQRRALLSTTQLSDGQLLVSQPLLDPLIISVVNGSDIRPLWPYHPWVSRWADVFTVTAASNAPVVAVSNERFCLLLSTTDTTTLCQIAGYEYIIEGKVIELKPVWINASGSQVMVKYVSEPDHKVSAYRYLGIYKSSDPCEDHLIGLIGDGLAYPELDRDSEILQTVSVSIIGDVAFATVQKDNDPNIADVTVLTGLKSEWPYFQTQKVYPNAHTGLLLSGDTRGVVDDTSGVAVVSVTDTAFYSLVNLGLRHLPLAVMHGTQRVITYTDKTLHCVDVDNGSVLWSMPVASQPTNILVDRTDRWFLCTYADDYSEMFALDTTVSVSEAGSTRNELVVSPNPANETLSLRAPFPISEYALYDVLGNMVMSASVEPATTIHSVNIEALPNGTYVLSVTTTMKHATAIVQKRRQ